MEQLNYVHLRGHIGNVRISKVGERSVCNFSVATNMILRNSESQPVEDTQWHICVVWSSKKLPDLSCIVTGAPVEVEGRLRTNRYTGSDSVERSVCEVQVTNLSMLPAGERLQTPAL